MTNLFWKAQGPKQLSMLKAQAQHIRLVQRTLDHCGSRFRGLLGCTGRDHCCCRHLHGACLWLYMRCRRAGWGHCCCCNSDFCCAPPKAWVTAAASRGPGLAGAPGWNPLLFLGFGGFLCLQLLQDLYLCVEIIHLLFQSPALPVAPAQPDQQHCLEGRFPEQLEHQSSSYKHHERPAEA